ncbi:uncharacterized protein LOC130728692 [Lotus japonicus]|uniref:uncharacterized protein LOC130728692 n=1 Tax=Lotus japonicus TaxID=34305 RepID=UPI00258D9E41|nr:uncharacterized protein LOC130728692 [Lotus japonicus]
MSCTSLIIPLQIQGILDRILHHPNYKSQAQHHRVMAVTHMDMVVIKVTSMEDSLHHLQLHLLLSLTITTTMVVLVAHLSLEAVWLPSVAAAFWTNVASRDSWMCGLHLAVNIQFPQK